MSRTIRIDDDIWEALKSQATPLEDTPSSVLRRILNQAGLLGDVSSGITPVGAGRPPRKDDRLQQPVQELFSPHTMRGLDNAGVRTLGDLVLKTEEELRGTSHIGRRSLAEIRKVLTGMGLSLKEQAKS